MYNKEIVSYIYYVKSFIICLISMTHTLFFAMESLPKEVQKQIATYVTNNKQLLKNFESNTKLSFNKKWSLLAYANLKSKSYYENDLLAQRLKYEDWRKISVAQDAVLQKMYSVPRKYYHDNLFTSKYHSEIYLNINEIDVIKPIPHYILKSVLQGNESLTVKPQFSINSKQLLYDSIEIFANILQFDLYNAIKKTLPYITMTFYYNDRTIKIKPEGIVRNKNQKIKYLIR